MPALLNQTEEKLWRCCTRYKPIESNIINIKHFRGEEMKPVMIINKTHSIFCYSKIQTGILIVLFMFSWNTVIYAESGWNNMSTSEKIIGPICLIFTLYKIVQWSNSSNPNQAIVDINSEPQGGRVYDEQGGYKGVTPLKLSYTINEDAYQAGIIRCSPLICFIDNHLPQKVQMELKVDYEIPKNTNKKINYHQLFVLQRDPNAPQVSEQKIDITTRQEDSNLDKALKTMNLMLMIQSLQPIK